MKSDGSNSVWRCCGLGVAAVALCTGAVAEPPAAEPAPAMPPAVAVVAAAAPVSPSVVAPVVTPIDAPIDMPIEAPLRLSPSGASMDWRSRAAADLQRPAQQQWSRLSIVELPAEGVPGARTRPRHALSLRSDAPKRMLRSIGIEATDCATRFRLPTKFRRDAEGGRSLEFRADLGLACRF